MASGAGKRSVLVTGAAGHIGSYFTEHSSELYDFRLMVHETDDASTLQGRGEIVVANLADLNALKSIMAGVDTVVHLAADPSPVATWDSLLPNNIVGTYNAMVAARAAGCRRVVYASSIHAVSGYPVDVQVKTNEPVNPGDLYGVTKCFGEALGRYMAEQEGLSVIALRIGAFQPLSAARDPSNVDMLDAFVSRRDLTQLIQLSIDAEDIRFAIFHGLSDNRYKRLDISDARERLGYAPMDDLSEENPELGDLGLSGKARGHNASDPGQKSGIRREAQ
jgi:UDP-glucose 4-epimerase